MCDSCAQGGGGGTRRCHRDRNGLGVACTGRRSDSQPAVIVTAGDDERSVHQALCGGIAAGVLFGGVLGGVVVGVAAFGASIVSRRARDSRGGDNVRVVPCGPAAAMAAADGGGGMRYGGVMTQEQAMLATGRAISTITTTATTTCAVAAAAAAAPGRAGCGLEGVTGASEPPLPSAQLVTSPVAIPCTSRSIRGARRLTAVTATPAGTNNVVFGVSTQCAHTAGDANGATAAPAGGGLVPGAPAPAVAVPMGSGGGDGADRSGNSIADTARRWWRSSMAGISGSAGDEMAGSWEIGGSDQYGSEEEEEGEDWWAGEEFQGDWACVFEAYCPDGGGGGRMPSLVAREPLQGSGVSVRVARAILQIADWHGEGDLGLDEFFFAMYLCRRHRLGEGIPSMLEAWMIPPSLREARGCHDNGPSPAYPP